MFARADEVIEWNGPRATRSRVGIERAIELAAGMIWGGAVVIAREHGPEQAEHLLAVVAETLPKRRVTQRRRSTRRRL